MSHASDEQREISRYQLNHPKAYFGYTLALAEGGDREIADELTTEYVTGGAGMARRGAQNLGLVTETDGSLKLTSDGQYAVAQLPKWFDVDDRQAVLAALDEMRGARERFVDAVPGLKHVGPTIARQDPTIDRLVDHLAEIHADRVTAGREYAIDTAELVYELYHRDPAFGGQLLIREHEGVRELVLGEGEPDAWDEYETVGQIESIEWGHLPHDPDEPVYHSGTTFTVKTLCWHLGVLQSKGTQASELDPHELTWAPEPGIATERAEAALPTCTVQEGEV